MNKKLFSLALAGALSLSLLAGCSSPNREVSPSPTPTPTESVQPSGSPDVAPMPVPTPGESAAPEVTPLPPANPDEGVTISPEPADPSESHPAVTLPDKGTPPADVPAAKPEPSQTVPAPTPSAAPTPTPSEAPAPETSAVQSVWNQVSGLERPELMDIDSVLLADLYGIDSADVVEFIGKMPMMSANVTEFLIVQAAPGKADTVKAACAARLETLKAGGQYPANQTLVDNYKLVVNGDYVLFCIDEHADAMVEAFNSYTK